MKNKKQDFQIYLDLDGVFADFNGGFKKLTGSEPKEVAKKVLWSSIYKADHFFYNLEVIPDSKKLWEFVKPTHPIFLTGLPSSIEGRDDKVRWVHKHYGPQYEVIVLPKKEKRKHAAPNHILVDDTAANVSEWKADGGIGILHEEDNYHRTISELKKVLKEQFHWE